MRVFGVLQGRLLIDIWFARHLVPGASHLDAGEFLDVLTATPTELMQWCQDGTITDAKTICGVFWLQNLLNNSWSPRWQPVFQIA
jgi:ADP-ribose pyrophosphatase